MPIRHDAVEGEDFIYTQHPENPDLQCKAWLDDDGNIVGYRSLGDDGREPGQLIEQPPALIENQMNKGSQLVNIRWTKNRKAVNDAITEWAAEILKNGNKGSLPIGKNGLDSEAASTKVLITKILERIDDEDNLPPLRDITQAVKELLVMSDRMGKDDKAPPVVAVQVNVSEGLFSKGFGS
jgi:hypothetical protein